MTARFAFDGALAYTDGTGSWPSAPTAIRSVERFQTVQQPTVSVVHFDRVVRESICWAVGSSNLATAAYDSAEAFLRRLDPTTPGCLVLDVRLPGMSGLDLQAELAARHLEIPTVFVTGSSDVRTAVRACTGGAVDFMELPFSCERLLEAVRRAIKLDRAQRSRWIGCRMLTARAARLSARERQVMAGVVAGKTSKELAAELGIRCRTVEGHRARLMKKLHVDSVVALTRVAVMLDAAGSWDVSRMTPSSPATPPRTELDPPDYVAPDPPPTPPSKRGM
jgi:FixJ family two-component response regulator